MKLKTVLVHVPEDVHPDDLMLILNVSRDLPEGAPWAIELIDMNVFRAAVSYPPLDIQREGATGHNGRSFLEDVLRTAERNRGS